MIRNGVRLSCCSTSSPFSGCPFRCPTSLWTGLPQFFTVARPRKSMSLTLQYQRQTIEYPRLSSGKLAAIFWDTEELWKRTFWPSPPCFGVVVMAKNSVVLKSKIFSSTTNQSMGSVLIRELFIDRRSHMGS